MRSQVCGIRSIAGELGVSEATRRGARTLPPTWRSSAVPGRLDLDGDDSALDDIMRLAGKALR